MSAQLIIIIVSIIRTCIRIQLLGGSRSPMGNHYREVMDAMTGMSARGRKVVCTTTEEE